MSATERLKKLLEEHHTEPFTYHFKFVMPAASVEAFSKLIPGIETSSRLSSNSKFVSMSFDFHAENAQQIVDIYHRVQSVPGLMAL
jgi:putative lipoic acid-binding regulatory protein